MANSLFGWPIYSDSLSLLHAEPFAGQWYSPALSGGSWSASLPLANLQDRRLHKVARSSDALAASTQFDCDLGAARLVGLVAIPKHTMTAAGTIRVRGYTGSSHTTNVYDSGTLTPFPSGLGYEQVVGLNVPFVVLPNVTARYWFVEFTDTANPNGYIDVSRLVIAGSFTPTINILNGSGQGLEDLSTVTDTEGGSAIITSRPLRRRVTATLDEMTESEMFTSFWRMQKYLGVRGQVFFMWDGADTTYKHDRAFLGRFTNLSPITMAAWPRYTAPFQIVEEI